mmetsp:Transcript_89419/g.277875  ORF Transcript_89419/g.277875 Transcript_89419/m.277875 type:complete len:106 (+) Transcript_89419:293-610(+)
MDNGEDSAKAGAGVMPADHVADGAARAARNGEEGPMAAGAAGAKEGDRGPSALPGTPLLQPWLMEWKRCWPWRFAAPAERARAALCVACTSWLPGSCDCVVHSAL